MHRREAQLPIDLEIQESELELIYNFDESLKRRISALKGTFIDAQIMNLRKIQHAQERQRERQVKLRKAQTYKIGDIVLLYDSAKQNVHGDKFSIRWTGPFWIDKILGSSTYLIRDKLEVVKQRPVHVERLKHYKQRYLVEPHVIIAPDIALN